MEINFFENGSFVGAWYLMEVNGKKHRLGRVCDTQEEAAIDAARILKEIYNIDYNIDDMQFKWGGCL